MQTLSELVSPTALKLLATNGVDLVHEIGLDVVRGVVLDILTGRSLRDSTEALTRRRIAALNLAITQMFLQGAASSSDFVARLPHLATELLGRNRLNKADKWLAQWALGLTDKAVQNVLRDDPSALEGYRNRYIETCRQVIANHEQAHGTLLGELALDSGAKAQVNWLFMTYLLNTIGAQTLAIRGSEKSAYGKLFEKLVLGSLLHILGFTHVTPPPQKLERVFWLSAQGEKRESDATLLYEAGKGVRFDIGFIGRGNPEISLDKVTRFEREISLGRSRWYMATIIIVDRIGANSRIENLAQGIRGKIIQMSAGYWPQQVAQELHRVLGFDHLLLTMNPAQIGPFFAQEMARAPLEEFMGPNK